MFFLFFCLLLLVMSDIQTKQLILVSGNLGLLRRRLSLFPIISLRLSLSLLSLFFLLSLLLVSSHFKFPPFLPPSFLPSFFSLSPSPSHSSNALFLIPPFASTHSLPLLSRSSF